MGDHRETTIVAVGEAEIHQSNFEEVLTHDDDSFSLMFENMDSKFQDLNGFHSSSLKLLTSRTKFPELDASSSRRMRVRANVSHKTSTQTILMISLFELKPPTFEMIMSNIVILSREAFHSQTLELGSPWYEEYIWFFHCGRNHGSWLSSSQPSACSLPCSFPFF